MLKNVYIRTKRNIQLSTQEIDGRASWLICHHSKASFLYYLD
jgi:hypothetical protein